MKKTAEQWKKRLHAVNPLTFDEFLATYSGRRKARYALAVERLIALGPVTKDAARCSAFVKAEKLDPDSKINPDPRMIQPRDPTYNVELGIYTKACEHQLYKVKGPKNSRVIAKGKNQGSRGRMLARKRRKFSKPAVISLDCSRFDKHISLDHLQIEGSVYLSVFQNDPRLAQLLSWQWYNKCRTSKGVKYTTKAKRMSGDMNTGLGNCMLACIMIETAMRKLGFKKNYDYVVDGDDCLVMVEECDVQRLVDFLPSAFLQMGHEIRIEGLSTEMEGIEFCQSKPVWVDGSYRMVREPFKVMSTSCCGTRHWTDPFLVRPMLTAVGQCEMALSRGVPILQSLGLAQVRNGRGAMKPEWFSSEYGFGKYTDIDGLSREPAEISWDTRLSFQKAFGISPLDQIDIEKILDLWEIENLEGTDVPAELDYRWKQEIDLEDPILCSIRTKAERQKFYGG